MKVSTLNTPCMDAMDNHGGMYCRTLDVINNTQKIQNVTCVKSQNEQVPENPHTSHTTSQEANKV